MPARVHVREANPSELPAVLNVLDGSFLQTDYEAVEQAIETGDVLVGFKSVEAGNSDAQSAVTNNQSAGSDERSTSSDARSTGGEERSPGSAEILGALVLDGEEIVAVAVRRRRRGQGIGSALVDAARNRHGRLVAHFRESVRPFWESLEFDIESTDEDGRFRGVLHPE